MHRCDDFDQRFLCLTGVMIRRDIEMSIIKPQMEELKTRHFGEGNKIFLHRSNIINANRGFESLVEEDKREAFNQHLLALLSTWNYKVWSVCIDKKAHRDRYLVWQHHPYHYCMEVLLEKVALFLKRFNHQCDVVVEARTKEADKKLKKCFAKVYNRGTEHADAATCQRVFTSKELKLKPKTANIAGLQLADLIAHPSKTEILALNQIVKDDGSVVLLAPFAYAVSKIIERKYDQWQGNIYGRKFI